MCVILAVRSRQCFSSGTNCELYTGAAVILVETLILAVTNRVYPSRVFDVLAT